MFNKSNNKQKQTSLIKLGFYFSDFYSIQNIQIRFFYDNYKVSLNILQ
jgi:hypothetical protein